ncbi:MAG: hypothetical protein IKQ71_08775 [Lachnospiraceae bacterium]|nr:hypothetical protein [Lachnospiraceae bacterium]
MNSSAANTNLILTLLGIIILGVAVFLGAKPNWEDKQSIDEEVKQLQAKYDDLSSKKARQAEYEAGIEEYNRKYEEKLAKYPANLNQEYTVAFIEGIRQNYEFNALSLGLGKPEEFYVLGAKAAPEAAPAEGENAEGDGTEEAAAPAADAATDAAAVTTQSGPVAYKAQFPISYEGSYEGIKDFLNYVAGYKYRMTVDSTSITYDEESQKYTGAVTMSAYCVEDEGRASDPIDFDKPIGVSNIFAGEGGSTSSAAGLSKYDDNQGAEIANNYEFYLLLNGAESENSVKAAGKNGVAASEITSDVNDIEAVKFEFYEKDGKNYVTYSIGDKSYEAEVTSANDTTIYVKSSSKASGDDKSGANVTISNKMSIPVYVKVADDDSTSPRFKLSSKTGQIRVY